MARSASPLGANVPEQVSEPIVVLTERSQPNYTAGAAHAAIINEQGETEPGSKKRKHKHHKKHKHKHKKQKRSSAERKGIPATEVPEAVGAPFGREDALVPELSSQNANVHARLEAPDAPPGSEHTRAEPAWKGTAREQPDVLRSSSAPGVASFA